MTGIAFSNDHDLMGLTPIATANILLDRGDQELSVEVLVVGVGWILASTCGLKVGACTTDGACCPKRDLLSFDQDLMGITPIATANIPLDRGDQELSFEVLVAIIGALEAEFWLLEVGTCNGV